MHPMEDFSSECPATELTNDICAHSDVCVVKCVESHMSAVWIVLSSQVFGTGAGWKNMLDNGHNTLLLTHTDIQMH